MNNIFFIFLLVCLTISCKRDESATDLFPNSIKLYHEKIFENDESVFRNGEMIYFNIDSSLIIQSFKSDSLLIKINLKDKRISHFIPFGNGPDEFVDIQLAQQSSDSTLIFMDINSSQLLQLNIVTGVIDKGLVYDNSKCLRMVKLNEHYFSTGVFEEGMFGIWDSSNFINYAIDYPKDNVSNKNKASKGLAYQGKLLVNEGLNRLFFCSSLFSYFELFEISSGDININSIKKSYIGEYNYAPSYDKNIIFAHPYESNREGYLDAVATKDRIYLLYSGRTIEDVGIENREKTRLANHILVYDWNGIPLSKYETDIDLKNICINSAGNIIYGVSHIPDPEVVFFKIDES